MNGKFNGVQLRRITSHKITTTDHGTTLYSFRAVGHLPELEKVLRLVAPALLILRNETVEGKIVHYSEIAGEGYDVTIEG